MLKCFFAMAVVAALSSSAAPPDKFFFVDLDGKGTHKLSDDFGQIENNNLGVLKKGLSTFAGVNFKVGEKAILLHGKFLPQKVPEKVEGIVIGKEFKKLHLFHATAYGAGNPGANGYIAVGSKIAVYTLHYADDTTAEIPVVYGEDVRDWWSPLPDAKMIKNAKVGWNGENEASKGRERILTLYVSTWDNPHPGKKVNTIDYAKTAIETPAAPFCVAMTLEMK